MRPGRGVLFFPATYCYFVAQQLRTLRQWVNARAEALAKNPENLESTLDLVEQLGKKQTGGDNFGAGGRITILDCLTQWIENYLHADRKGLEELWREMLNYQEKHPEVSGWWSLRSGAAKKWPERSRLRETGGAWSYGGAWLAKELVQQLKENPSKGDEILRVADVLARSGEGTVREAADSLNEIRAAKSTPARKLSQ